MDKQDTLKRVAEVVNQTLPENENGIATWLWIVGIVFLVLLLFATWKHKHSEHEQLRKKMKNGAVDFSQVMNSAFHSKELYDTLKKRCHPDRFAGNPQMIAIATALFASIVENKYNYQALLDLKKRAEQELHINFK